MKSTFFIVGHAKVDISEKFKWQRVFNSFFQQITKILTFKFLHLVRFVGKRKKNILIKMLCLGDLYIYKCNDSIDLQSSKR